MKKILIILSILTLTSTFAYAAPIFNDVPPKSWYASDVEKAAQYGVMKGDPDGNFRPDSPITRAELAVVIDNLMSKQSNDEQRVLNAVANAIPSTVEIQTLNGDYGSGVYVDKNEILTAYHVIKDNNNVEIKFSNGNQCSGVVTKSDSTQDLALIKVDYITKNPVQLANKVEVGETAIAIGTGANLPFSVSKGIVSALHRQFNTGKNLTQIDTPINPGNSGGLLMDSSGELIGIVDSKIEGVNYEGLAFAVSLDDIKKFLGR